MTEEEQKKGIRQRLLLFETVCNIIMLGGDYNNYLTTLPEEERKELAEAWDKQSHVPVGVMFNRPKFEL